MDTRRKILVVDDDPNLRKTLSDILKAEGYAPLPVARGKTALDRVKKEAPSVALIDLKLGDMSGLEVMGEIRKVSPKTECIVITGHASQESAIEAINLGAYSYVQKPYDMSHLLVTVRRAMEKVEAETALRESENRYRRMTEAVTDYIFTVRVEKGRPVETIHNPACEGVTGYTPEEFASDPYLWIRMVPEEDREIVQDQASRILSGNDPQPIEHRILRKDDLVRWVSNTPVPYHDAQGNLISYDGLIKDITDRKQAEEALRKEALRRRILMDAGLDGIAIINQEHKVVEANQRFAEMLGYTHEEVINLHTWDWDAEMSEAEIRADFKDLTKAKSIFETRHRRKDGTTYSVEVSASGVKVGDEPMVFTVSRDITERKQAEEALQRQRDEQQVILDSVPAMIFYKDKENHLIRINRALAEIAGKTKAEMEGKSLFELYPDQAEDYWRDDKDVMTSGQPKRHIIEPLETPEGVRCLQTDKIPYRDEKGNIIGIIGFAIDITERKQAEEALERSERLYRDAIEVAGAVPYYQNYETDTYEFVAERIRELTGYSPEEFTPDIWFSIMGEEILLGSLAGLSREEAIQRARREEGVSWRADYRIRTRSGEERWVSNAAVQVKDDQGKVVGSLGILQDMTERKRLEEQLRQAQKMEAVGQLAGGVAHDFNNLLTGVIGYLALAEVDSPEEIRGFLANAQKTADRMADLVKQLLAFSRKSRVALRPVDLNHILDEVHRLVRQTIDRRIDIEVRTEESLPNVLADAAQINSVLMNLCINARDAINEVMDGRVAPERRGHRFVIILETNTTVFDEEYCDTRPEVLPGRFIVISVSDNGEGMDAETRRRAFEPFFTTKGVGKGSGLGLSSTYGIIRQHGGWIDIYTERGKGTTFKIYLPVAKEEIQSDENEDSQEIPGGTETILLVDDEKMIRNLGKDILERYGYIVLLAADGKEGLNLYLEQRDRIALIILDLSMPHLSGREVLERIRAVAPDAKVIVSTGYGESKETESLARLGVGGYASKPYRPADLAREVRKVLDAPQRGQE